MMEISRRSLLKIAGSVSAAFALPACSKTDSTAAATPAHPTSPTAQPPAIPASQPTNVAAIPTSLGYLAIVQGPTSQTESLINVLSPRLKKYDYTVSDSTGASVTVDKYDTVTSPTFYSVDKLKVSGLKLGETYTLTIKDKSNLIDKRTFQALDTSMVDPKFALISCMCDDHSFEPVIDPMWKRLREQDVDFVFLAGDEVYVDSFEFVERLKANEFDLWQRYVDTLRRLPIYRWTELKPIFAVWDDHDYGTNDGDRDFISKDQALRLFHAVYGGQPLAGVWEQGPLGCSSSLTAFGQRFYLMDDRTFRQPNKNQTTAEPYGHWGQPQHEWLINNLTQNETPTWIINGNQFFNGVALSYKEAFEQNHPAEFVNFINDLKNVKSPVVFASGDVHLSEIMRIPPERIGYETFEVTSSSMHSFVGTGWQNPMRLQGAYTLEYNFLVINSRAEGNKMHLGVTSWGIAPTPYFTKDLVIDSTRA